MLPLSADSILECVLTRERKEMFLWSTAPRACPDVTHAMIDCVDHTAIHCPSLNLSFFTHMRWPKADFILSDTTVNSIYFPTHDCLFYLLLSALMPQVMCRTTRRYYLVTIYQTWTPERLSEFCMLYIWMRVYLSSSMIIIAVNMNAFIMSSESEPQKLEWRAGARALHDYSQLGFQRRGNVYSS